MGVGAIIIGAAWAPSVSAEVDPGRTQKAMAAGGYFSSVNGGVTDEK